MLTNFLLRKYVGKNNDYNVKETRNRVGYLASIVGIILNIFLAIIKFFIGYIISSVSVTADAVNNLTDTGSSAITLIGFRLANKPPDRDHPYGHGRVEYIAALVVAFMVILVGFQFIQTSLDRVLNPQPINFEMIPFIILIVSIIVKVWMIGFNSNLGKKIDSTGLKATAQDAFGDVLTTSVVALSIILGQFTSFPIDGIVGIIVSILIMYNGVNLVRETISPLIGETPSKELLDSIMEDVLSYEHITGAHDLYVHFYGAHKTMAVIDVEFPAEVDVIEMHRIVHDAEREIGEKYDLTLVIHMDPLHEESEEDYQLRQEVKKTITTFPNVKSMHDFHIVEDDLESRIVEFHLVVDGNNLEETLDHERLRGQVVEALEERFSNIKFDIIVDIKFLL